MEREHAFVPEARRLALAALIQGFGGADTIAFSAQFAFRGGRAGALLAGARLGLRQFLAPTGEAGFPDGDAGATSAFRATLAAVGFARVGIAFTRPLVLLHSATGTRRRRNRFPQTSASLFFRFHTGSDLVGRLSDMVSVLPAIVAAWVDYARPARIATPRPQRLRVAMRAGEACGRGGGFDKTTEDRIVRTMSDTPDDAAWREQCRHQLERDVATRIKYGFCHVHKPVLDDVPVRTFTTMEEYRRWCDRELPAYLGYRLAPRER
jgi:hypothetical protein